MTDNVIKLPLKMPPALARQVSSLNRTSALEPVPDPAAAEWLRRKRDLIKQADREDCRDWLVLLALGINGVTENEFEHRVVAIWEMCGDLPAFVWCVESRRAIWARTPFLPTPGECREVLEAHAAPLLAEIAALERIVAAPTGRTVAVEGSSYRPPPAPEWAADRAVERTPLFEPQPPVRTVEEQIAALNAPSPPVAG